MYSAQIFTSKMFLWEIKYSKGLTNQTLGKSERIILNYFNYAEKLPYITVQYINVPRRNNV